jgi:DNA-binding PadR family transcriptional regulator
MLIRIITLTITFGKSRARLRSIKYDVNILKALEQPYTFYALLKRFDYPHSSLHRLLSEYAKEDLVRIVKLEPYYTGKAKKFYRLTDKGKYFLRLVEYLEQLLSERKLEAKNYSQNRAYRNK